MDEVAPTRSIGRNVGSLLVSQSATWLLATMLTVVQPRLLGPVGQGQLRIGTAVWSIVEVISTFGTSTLAQMEVARKPSLAGTWVRRIATVRGYVFLACWPGVAVLLLLAGYGRVVVAVVIIRGIASAVGLVTTSIVSVLYGLQEMGRTGVADVVNRVFDVALTIGVLLLGGRALAVSWVTVVTAVFSLLVYVRTYRPAARRAVANAVAEGSGIPAGDAVPPVRRLFRLAAPFLLADAMLVVYNQIDTISMSILTDERAIGWYATADVLFGSLLFLPNVLTTALFPAIAKMSVDRPDEVDDLLRRSLGMVMIVALPVGVGTTIVSKGVVALLYGSKFERTGPVLAVFGAVTVLSYGTVLLGRFAVATGHVRFWNVLMVTATVSSVPLDIVLVPWTAHRFHNGAIGGAIAYVVTEGIMLVSGLIRVRSHLDGRALLDRFVRCLLAAAAMTAAAWPLRDRFVGIPIAVGGLTYIVALVLLRGYGDDERRIVQRALGPVRRRIGRS